MFWWIVACSAALATLVKVLETIKGRQNRLPGGAMMPCHTCVDWLSPNMTHVCVISDVASKYVAKGTFATVEIFYSQLCKNNLTA
jgi:hypothetical protein